MFSFWHPPSSSSTAIVILGGEQRTNMKVRRWIAMLYFIICCCSSVVAPAFCHWQRYMHHRVSRWSFLQRDWNELLMHCHWAVSLCVLLFHWELENLGARDVSAARTLLYTVTVCFVVLKETRSKESLSSFTISRFTMENNDADALKGGKKKSTHC